MARSSSSTVLLVVLVVLIVVALALHLLGATPLGWMDGLKSMHGRG